MPVVTRENNYPFKVRPTMRLTCRSGERSPANILAEVSYGDTTEETYYVGDATGQTQNRTVFTVLSYLYAQTAIGTQSLPVQQLIQVQ